VHLFLPVNDDGDIVYDCFTAGTNRLESASIAAAKLSSLRIISHENILYHYKVSRNFISVVSFTPLSLFVTMLLDLVLIFLFCPSSKVFQMSFQLLNAFYLDVQLFPSSELPGSPFLGHISEIWPFFELLGLEFVLV